MTVVRSVDHIGPASARRILHRASELRAGTNPTSGYNSTVVATAFFTPSLRSRVGFEVAAARLGWETVDAAIRRGKTPFGDERVSDTLRVLAGMVDVLIVRTDGPLDAELPELVSCDVLNAGDGGRDAEHPSQALIDQFAIEQMRGPLSDQVICVLGDLRMRSVRSFLRLLMWEPPRRLLLITEPALTDDALVPPQLAALSEMVTIDSLDEIDVLYLAGMPRDSASDSVRRAYSLGTHELDRLAHKAIVLSPMPIIDELTLDALIHPRVRVFEQSDLGMFVRIALLEAVRSGALAS